MVPMQRPKWLDGWGKGNNLFEGSIVIDLPDINVVEASLDKKLVLVAMGIAQKRDTTFSKERNDKQVRGKYKGELEWRIFYDPTAIPDFIPADKAKDFMAGAVAVSSRSSSVYSTNTVYIADGKKPSKGNAPLLLDYELAKKIEQARKGRTDGA